MASLETRKRPTGTSYRVKWRADGTWQSESFGASRKTAAGRFLRDVEQNGNRWPDGWLKGFGYIRTLSEDAEVAEVRLTHFAAQYIADKTGLQPGTRCRYARQAEGLADALDALVDADVETDAAFATVQNLTPRHVSRWINARERAGSSPKTIANWHGLLFQVMQAAVDEGLREKNPCTSTGKALPRRDAYKTEDDRTFLTEGEFALIADAMWPGLPDPRQNGAVKAVGTESDRDLLMVAVGTGARWGELTALRLTDVRLGVRSSVSIERAWKRNGGGLHAVAGIGRWYVGSPKTIRGRRRIRIGATVGEVLRRRQAQVLADGLLFTGSRGGPIDQPHFYEYRWQRAVQLAQLNGLSKAPRFHDLRHTYAAWLISAGVPLPEIQQRLGHESILTTVGVYGGLLEAPGDLANQALDAALMLGAPSTCEVSKDAPSGGSHNAT